MARSCTLKGNPFSLEGPELKPGDKAPEVALRKDLVSDIKLSETGAVTRVFSVVPSVDTPVCAIQTKKFWEHASKLPNVKFYTVSCDLPVAQKRFCGAEGIDSEKFSCLSDHKDLAFGKAFGTLIPDLRLESRAVFVVDKDNTIRHAEYVPEVATEPNYDAVLACLKGL
ncbi:MAG: thiol peroxidase [Phycisphaerales bacterium]|nr:thiol peroxidase [Phycisphaerales bacterium]